MNQNTIEKISFFLMLLTILWPALVLDTIVTGDGPTHLYTSKVLVDWFMNKDAGFYQQFMELNPRFSPNWWTNVLQMFLLKFFSVQWAEKIFFILYLLSFSFGFRKLIKVINPESIFLASVGLLFAWSHILLKGFTNNAWSLVFWFWIMAVWMEAPKKEYIRHLKLVVLFLLCYLAHPIGLMLSLISIVVFTLFEGVTLRKKASGTELLSYFWKKGFSLALVSLPAVILFGRFFMSRSWHKDVEIINRVFVLVDILRLHAILIFSSQERDWVTGISIFILVLFFWMLVKRIKVKVNVARDYFLALVVVMLLITFFPPKGISKGLVIGVRFGMLPHLAILMWLAVNKFSDRMKKIVPFIALVFSVGLLVVRMPVFKQASNYAEEVIDCKEYIANHSTLLVLNNDWVGHRADGAEIADRNWLFNHVDCYLGAYKQLFISDYYEANQDFFPFIAKEKTSMYSQTSIEGINFDNRPPRADILGYKKRSGYEIDYILLLGYQKESLKHPYSQEIIHQLGQAYHEIHRSSERVVLYQRNN